MGHANREAAYSPLWLMLTVTWKPNADKRVLKSEEEVLDAAQKGWVTLLSTGVVVNCPIVHRGPRCCRSPATAAWQPPATQNTARCRGQKTIARADDAQIMRAGFQHRRVSAKQAQPRVWEQRCPQPKISKADSGTSSAAPANTQLE